MNNFNKKIAFLQVAHFPNDDRVWYHQTKLLKEHGYDVSVISTRTDNPNLDLDSVHCFDDTNMPKKKVSKILSDILNKIKPDLIICDNPLSIIFAFNYKKRFNKNTKIVVDITEWYPSKKNLVNLNFIKRIIKKFVLEFMNFYSGFLVDGFVFGEDDKARIFKKYFSRKIFVDLPYYPDLNYINVGKTKQDFSTWKVLYSGSLTQEKGFDNVINAINITASENQCFDFLLDIISNDIPTEKQKNTIDQLPNNIKTSFLKYLPFEEFCNTIANYDIFFDLRITDKENNKCLPIKLFYYMACGRPVIFSNLKAIRSQVSEIYEFGNLTDPTDCRNISKIISDYIADNAKYLTHSTAALEYSRNKYNWRKISDNFLNFITNVLNKS